LQQVEVGWSRLQQIDAGNKFKILLQTGPKYEHVEAREMSDPKREKGELVGEKD